MVRNFHILLSPSSSLLPNTRTIAWAACWLALVGIGEVDGSRLSTSVTPCVLRAGTRVPRWPPTPSSKDFHFPTRTSKYFHSPKSATVSHFLWVHPFTSIYFQKLPKASKHFQNGMTYRKVLPFTSIYFQTFLLNSTNILSGRQSLGFHGSYVWGS